jgi:uncharacterized repeat protein (TIGR01451 family)
MSRVTGVRACALAFVAALALGGRPAAAEGDANPCKDAPFGTPCENDGNKCTIDKCDGQGNCDATGNEVRCHEAIGPCDNGKFCEPETGACIKLPDVPEGTPCDKDDSKCTPEACDANGQCIAAGPAKSCDDGDVCTDDTCVKETGACGHVEDTTNSPICLPDTDLEIVKEARCRCEAKKKDRDCRSRVNFHFTRTGDDGDDDVVFCTREEDKSYKSFRHRFFFKFGRDSGKDKCRIAYDIKVTNKGPGDATGIEVTDLLPAGVKFVEFEASQGTFNPTTGRWDVGNMAAGVEATLAIDVKSDEGSSYSSRRYDYDGDVRIKNCADITKLDQLDTNPENDSSCVTVSTEEKKDRYHHRW